MIPFAQFVDAHAEEMRKLFVTHDGQKKLTVQLVSVEGTDWSDVIAQLSDMIQTNTTSDVRTWMEPKFSTTTPKDALIGRVLLMGAMKNYFSYGGSVCCGLPAITLEGTLDDWKDLRSRADQLLVYAQNSNTFGVDLKKWHALLVPVLDEFIKTYQGDVDKNFWNTILTEVGGGSGPSYLTGFCNVFMPFKDGKFVLDERDFRGEKHKYGLIETSDVPSGAIEVPFTINDNGHEIKTIFYTGALVASYDPVSNRISPSFDWVMINVSNSRLEAYQKAKEDFQTVMNSETMKYDERRKKYQEFRAIWGELANDV